MSMKLFIWENVKSKDCWGGIAFAIADNVEDARKSILESDGADDAISKKVLELVLIERSPTVYSGKHGHVEWPSG